MEIGNGIKDVAASSSEDFSIATTTVVLPQANNKEKKLLHDNGDYDDDDDDNNNNKEETKPPIVHGGDHIMDDDEAAVPNEASSCILEEEYVPFLANCPKKMNNTTSRGIAQDFADPKSTDNMSQTIQGTTTEEEHAATTTTTTARGDALLGAQGETIQAVAAAEETKYANAVAVAEETMTDAKIQEEVVRDTVVVDETEVKGEPMMMESCSMETQQNKEEPGGVDAVDEVAVSEAERDIMTTQDDAPLASSSTTTTTTTPPSSPTLQHADSTTSNNTETATTTPPAAKLPVSSPAYTRSKRKREIAAASSSVVEDTTTTSSTTEKRTKVIVICENVETQILETRTLAKNKKVALGMGESSYCEKEPEGKDELTTQQQQQQQQQDSMAAASKLHDTEDNDGPPKIVRRTTTTTTNALPSPPDDPYAETYVELANRMIFTLDSDSQQVLQALELPGGAISGLGLLKIKAKLRRPSVLEKWSPWEIGLFQAGVAHHGKKFDLVQKEVVTKSVQEVIDFYLIWKKTSHYKAWKQEYLPPHMDVDSEDEAMPTAAAASAK